MIGKFIRGVMDGSLSTLGIVVGASSAAPAIVVAAGIGGAVANSIANFLSAVSAERTTMFKELRSTERAMVRKGLKGSILEGNIRKATVKAGLVDGLGTLLGGAVPVVPFMVRPYPDTMVISIGLVIITIFLIGIYLGKLSRENIYLSGLKMVAFALVIAGVVFIIQGGIVSAE